MSFARVRALIVMGALVLCAVVLVTTALLRDGGEDTPTAKGCGDGAVVADIRLPNPEEVTLRVFSGANRPDQARAIAEEFQNRGFVLDKETPPGNDPSGKQTAGVGIVRYGPKAAGKAWLVRAYFLNEAKTEFDIKREDTFVDVVLGSGFKQLATLTEVNQALGQVGSPVLPPGTCSQA